MKKQQRKPSDVPTDNVDQDIPEPTRPRGASLAPPVAGPALNVPGADPDQTGAADGMGPGEVALDRERRAVRTRPRT